MSEVIEYSHGDKMAQAIIKVMTKTSATRKFGEPQAEQVPEKVYFVLMNGVTHDRFKTLAEAQALCDKLNETEWVSPFKVHSDLLLNGDYGAAAALRDATMSFWNGKAYPFSLHRIKGFDNRHIKIFVELAESYHRYGEGDDEFMALCNEIRNMSERLLAPVE